MSEEADFERDLKDAFARAFIGFLYWERGLTPTEQPVEFQKSYYSIIEICDLAGPRLTGDMPGPIYLEMHSVAGMATGLGPEENSYAAGAAWIKRRYQQVAARQAERDKGGAAG